MVENKIELITNKSGEYVILRYKDFRTAGYEISEFDWMSLLTHLGYKIEHTEISDEEMEDLL